MYYIRCIIEDNLPNITPNIEDNLPNITPADNVYS